MLFANQLGTSILTIHLGQLPAADSKERTLLLEILNDLATHGNHVGTTLCVTPLGESPDELQACIADVTTGPIGINFDPAAYTMSGHNSTDAFRTLHESIQQIRARDGVRDLNGQGVETEFGRGAVTGRNKSRCWKNPACSAGWSPIARRERSRPTIFVAR